MNEDRAKEVEEYNNAQTDWYGKCRVCGECVKGSPATILAHKKECHGKGQ